MNRWTVGAVFLVISTVTFAQLRRPTWPVAMSVRAGGSLQLEFNTNTPVVWSLDEPALGWVSQTGAYIAPAWVESPQSDTVRATSAVDATKEVIFTITINPQVKIKPEQATILPGEALRFEANSTVVWSVVPSVGSIDSQGLYQGPMELAMAQTVQVVATSVSDPTNSGTVVVQLVPSLVVGPDGVELFPTQSQQFSANDLVSWTVSPPFGLINGVGLYTAPAAGPAGQIVSVVATRVTPPFDSASAEVVLKSADSLVFEIDLVGPRSVVQGYPVVLASKGTLLSGTAKQVKATLTGVPPNSTLQYISNVTRYTTPPNIGLDQIGLHIQTTGLTPLGTYPLTLTYAGTGADGTALTDSLTFDFVVRPMPGPLARLPFPPHVDLPAIAQWEQNMRQFGDLHLERDHIGCCGGFSEVWYYDGARAFQQIADYTGDERYLDFARRINVIYRDYILATGGRGFARYPHGLKMFFDREGDELSRAAVGRLATFSPRPYWSSSFEASREAAYSLSGNVLAEQLGFPRATYGGIDALQQQLELVIGHFEQWFVSESASYVYPFMVGLGAEALIDYYEISHDPRVPWLLKLAADKMYPNPNTWDEATESMKIVEVHSGQIVRGPAPDLNLMIAPLYGWLFQHTGDVRYRDIGDRIFASGVTRAYLWGGKQFTQNYRWSFKYVEWRKSPVSPIP